MQGLSLRDELVAWLAWMLERSRQEGELFAPASSRLSSPHQGVKRVELAFVVTCFALDSHRFERAVEAACVVEQWVPRADGHEETGERAVGSFSTLEDVKRVREIELAGRWVVKVAEVRFVDALEDVVHPSRQLAFTA
jgi:hypothetical protein